MESQELEPPATGMEHLEEKLKHFTFAHEEFWRMQRKELAEFVREHFVPRSQTQLEGNDSAWLPGQELELQDGPRLSHVSFVRPESTFEEDYQPTIVMPEEEPSGVPSPPLAVKAPEGSALTQVSEERSEAGSSGGSKAKRHSVVDDLLSAANSVEEAVVDYGRKLLQSDNFSFRSLDLAVGILIAINTVVMMIRNEYLGYEVGVELGAMEMNPLKSWDWSLGALERGFAVLFLVELLVRVAIQRCTYFKSCWNWFDVILVVVSMFDLFLLEMLQMEVKINVNVTMMRLARTVKLARAFRIMRTLRLFEGLRVLVHSVSAFLPSLMWAMIFLGLFIITGGILLGGLLQSYTSDPDSDPDLRYWVWRHYGTATRAIYTMFEITFAGSWPMYARPVIEQVGVGYCVFFVAYIVFVVFAVIRVISAIFLKETLDAAQNDAQLVVREKAKASQEYVKRLNKVFQTMDLSQDGVVSKEEFLQLCQDPTIKSYMTSLDVDVADGSHLFKLLDDGDGNLTHDEFISGMMRFKGSAKAIDVIYLQREVEWLQQELIRLTDKLIGPDLNDKRSRRRSHKVVTKKESEMLQTKINLDQIPPPELPHALLQQKLRT